MTADRAQRRDREAHRVAYAVKVRVLDGVFQRDRIKVDRDDLARAQLTHRDREDPRAGTDVEGVIDSSCAAQILDHAQSAEGRSVMAGAEGLTRTDHD